MSRLSCLCRGQPPCFSNTTEYMEEMYSDQHVLLTADQNHDDLTLIRKKNNKTMSEVGLETREHWKNRPWLHNFDRHPRRWNQLYRSIAMLYGAYLCGCLVFLMHKRPGLFVHRPRD
ncbi:hypothetical protein QR680_018999 [Steinernema hermaphroditum]|uniref:Uncharacterized protein n=1 Tax=Steinernema hermaphroditum TaxID=289476 RepID=A0AA39LRP6_9BILA|nr:hypothetical protein QR680_018999 [Steinernema hermaphroditum]